MARDSSAITPRLRKEVDERLSRALGRPAREEINVEVQSPKPDPRDDELRRREAEIARREQQILDEQRRVRDDIRERDIEAKRTLDTAGDAPPKRGFLSRIGGAANWTGGAAKTTLRTTVNVAQGTTQVLSKNYTALFIAAMLINFVDGLMNYGRPYWRFSMYLLLAVLSWAFVIRHPGDNFKGHLFTFGESLVMAAAAFFWPLFWFRVAGYTPIDIEVFRILVNIFPFYLIYIFMSNDPDCRKSTFIRIFKWVYFITIILLIVSFFPALAEARTLQNIPFLHPAENADVYGTYSRYISLVSNGWNWIKGTTKTTISDIDKFWELQQKAALGDLYIGDVDNEADKPLGVVLRDVKMSQKIYTTFDDVEIQGQIDSISLDRDVAVIIGCIADKGSKTPIEAVSYPAGKELELSRSESASVNCIFPAGTLPSGSHRLAMTSRFGFTTSAYMPAYFIDKNRADALREEGDNIYKQLRITEPLSDNKISNGEPKTVTTSGPVNIGMGIPNVLTEVDIQKDQKVFNLKITFTNSWGGGEFPGKIKNVREWYIQVPKEMEIAADTTGNTKCSGKKFIATRCPSGDKRCDDVNYKTYKLDPSVKLTEIDFLDSIACTIVIHGNSFNDLLGTGPLAAKQFRTWMTYDYEYERGNLNINIKKEETNDAVT